MSDAKQDLIERLQAASRDDRLADGMLYREAAQRIEELEAELAELKAAIRDGRTTDALHLANSED